MDLPIDSMVFFHSYVSLPEGMPMVIAQPQSELGSVQAGVTELSAELYIRLPSNVELAMDF